MKCLPVSTLPQYTIWPNIFTISTLLKSEKTVTYNPPGAFCTVKLGFLASRTPTFPGRISKYSLTIPPATVTMDRLSGLKYAPSGMAI